MPRHASFVEVVDGIACAISRVVGDVLIQVAEHSRDGRTLVLGHGYLISDFPLTDSALARAGHSSCPCSILTRIRERGFYSPSSSSIRS
jgi:hypothetical protein